MSYAHRIGLPAGPHHSSGSEGAGFQDRPYEIGVVFIICFVDLYFRHLIF
jgi:hypothetical protein